MADDPQDFSTVTLALITSAILFLYFLISKTMKDLLFGKDENENRQEERNPKSPSQYQKKSLCHGHPKKLNKKKRSSKAHKNEKDSFEHGWLFATLKGHNSNVTDIAFSPNGKYLASCAEERIILVWYTADWGSKYHKNVRVNVKYDNASLVSWSPDSKAFIIKRQRDNVIEAYKLNKSRGIIRSVTSAITFPRFHNDDIIGLGLSANGKYIMTASNKTDIVICDLKGTILTRLDSYVAVNYSAHLSPCGYFMIVSGFVPDARIWHVRFMDSGQFVKCRRLFDLRGHTAGVCDTSFDAYSSKVATVSKDGTWKLFDISVGFNKEEPAVISSGTYEVEEVSRIALSPMGDVVAVSSGSSLSLYEAETAELDIIISDIFSGPINRILFDAEGKRVLVCGGKYIRIFHNITGIKVGAKAAKEKLKHPYNTSALNERLRQQIYTAESFLASFNT